MSAYGSGRIQFGTDGELEVVLRGKGLMADLARDMGRQRAQHRWKLGTDLPMADVLLPLASQYVDLVGVVAGPIAEPARDSAPRGTGAWITTEAMAEVLGISDRAVRKRIAKNTLAGQKVGGRWLVNISREGEEHAA